MDINNDGFLTVKSRELNRLCKSAQVTDKKMYKIRSIDQVFLFLMYSINSNRETCIHIITSQYSVHQS